jgi:hypothetical protein
MPSSRRSREAIKQRKTVTAAEWRLRAEMGADLPVDDEYVSPATRERMMRDREQLRVAFAKLPLAERKRHVDSFRKKLRAASQSQRAYQGAWDAGFAPQLQAIAAPARPAPPPKPSRRAASEDRPSPARPAKTTATPSHRPATRGAAIPPQAARALDVKLRAARPGSDAEIALLTRQLNADRHFLAAFGGTVTERHIREGLKAVGQYRSGGVKKRRTK